MSKTMSIKVLGDELSILKIRLSMLEKIEKPTTDDLQMVSEIKARANEIKVALKHLKTQLGYRTA